MNYTIAKAHPQQDRDTLLALWSHNLPNACAARHEWLYVDGPAIGWIIRTADGPPIGAAGMMRRTVKFLDQTLPSGQAVDLNIDQQHRSLGPALALQRAVTHNVGADGLRLLYALPNDNSDPVLRRVGYHVFGQLQRWAKPLHSEPFLGERLPSSRLLRNPLAAAIDIVLMLTSREFLRQRPRQLHFEQPGSFDARFDAIWQIASQQFPVIGERTAAYLDWRFRQSPELAHEVLCLCDTSDRLLAYAVYSRHKGTIYLDDFLFLELQHLECVLAELLRRARRQRADAVVTVYLGSPDVEAVLQRYGFWKRPARWNALIYVDPRQPIPAEAQLFKPSNWHLTRADLDTDFQSPARQPVVSSDTPQDESCAVV